MPMTPIDASTTIPSYPPGFVPRDNVIMTIETMLTGDIDAVIVQGLDGMGKTTVLNSYVRTRSASVLCLFLRPVRVSYDPSALVAEFAAQMLIALGSPAQANDAAPPTQSEYAQLLQRLSTRLQRRREDLTIVIDGLAEVAARDRAAAQDIIDLLPIGRSGIRFVLSGDVEELLQSAGFRCKSYSLTLFSIDESRRLFSGLTLTDADVVRAHHACNGVIGHLAAVRRLVQSGLSLETIISTQPGDLSRMMQLEWNRASPFMEAHLDLLLVLTYDARRHTVSSLAGSAGIDPDVARRSIQSATFLTVAPDETVDFVSNTFRTFSQRRLEPHRQETLERLIASLVATPHEHHTLSTLPQLLSDAKQHKQLLSLLDPEHFAAVARMIESVSVIVEQASIGARAAEQTNDDQSVFRMRLTQSLACEVQRASPTHSEIQALVAVGETALALAIARAATFREERLTLFALTLAALVDRGDTIELALRDELRQLCQSSSPSTLGDSIIEVAGDVFAVEPEMALQLVERYGQSLGNPRSIDAVLALLSMRHSLTGRRAHDQASFAQFHERLADPQLRSLSEETGLASTKSDADWILDRSSKITDAESRISVLRLWLTYNRDRGDAFRVAAVAIELAVKTREYPLTVSVLRQFAECLPSADQPDDVQRLVEQIDALLTPDLHRSPSVDYVRLQILLARSLVPSAFVLIRDRLTDLYMFVQCIEDISVRAECLARLYAWLPLLEPSRQHDGVRTELIETVELVVAHSVEHDKTLFSILQPLTIRHHQLAFSLVNLANVDFRRDNLRLLLTEELARDVSDSTHSEVLRREITNIVDVRIQSDAVLSCLDVASRTDRSRFHTSQALWAHAQQLSAPDDRMLAFAYLARATRGTTKHDEAIAALEITVRSLDQPQDLGAAFTAICEIAQTDRSIAMELLGHVRRERASMSIGPAYMNGYALTARLAARGLRGVVRGGRGIEEELVRVLEMCERMTDPMLRVTTLSELCFWLDCEGRIDLAGRVHTERLLPTLNELRGQSSPRYWSALHLAGWSLFRRHEAHFRDTVRDLPATEREHVVRHTIATLLEGIPPTEPSDNVLSLRRNLEHRTLLDALSLLELIDDDWCIWFVLRAIGTSATRKDTTLTREQRVDLHARSESLITRKLPTPGKIQHDGYKWLCAAELLRIAPQGATESDWRELAGWARSIPNIPDCAFTIVNIVAAMPKRHDTLRKEVLQTAVAIARGIRVISERGDAIMRIADEVQGWDQRLAKELLRECLQIWQVGDIHDADHDRRVTRLLDVAYKVSPDFALGLSAEIDGDPARRSARFERVLSRERLEARRRMSDTGEVEAPLQTNTGSSLAEAAWANLAALHSGSLSARKANTLRKSLEAAARWPLSTSYHVFAWTIQNWLDRPADATQKASGARRLSQAAILCGETMRAISSKPFETREVRSTFDPPTPSRVILIGPGEKRKAIGVIRDWLVRTTPALVKIADPYFGPDELEFLKLIADHGCVKHVQVLTSSQQMRKLSSYPAIEDVFVQAWAKFSVDVPPPTDITVVGIPPAWGSPMHDRWWITEGSALDFGTSLNGLGLKQESSIQECDEQTAADMEAAIDKYLRRTIREAPSGRISYMTFSL
jgi:hypothetical protein